MGGDLRTFQNLLPVGQWGETCERSKRRWSFRSRGALDNSTSIISGLALQGFYAAQIGSLLTVFLCVLLTVHLSTVLVTDQRNPQILVL